LELYHAIQEKDKKSVDAIMQREIDEGIEEVLALAPIKAHRNDKSRRNRRHREVSTKPRKRRVESCSESD
jgi:hypothetical protein